MSGPVPRVAEDRRSAEENLGVRPACGPGAHRRLSPRARVAPCLAPANDASLRSGARAAAGVEEGVAFFLLPQHTAPGVVRKRSGLPHAEKPGNETFPDDKANASGWTFGRSPFGSR
jgi:hypothetical protein